MSRGKLNALVLLIVGIALSQAPVGASPAAVDLDRRLRDEFPQISQLIGTARGGATDSLRGFAADRFGDGYRIERGRMHVVLRPELSRRSVASVSPAGAAYIGAFPGVDAFRTLLAGAESEVLIVDNARDATAIAYRVTSADGILEIVNNGRGVRFVSGDGPDSFLSAPVAIDAAGRLSFAASWDIDRTDRGAAATLRLRVHDPNLKYPVAVIYSPGQEAILAGRTPVVNDASGSVSGTVRQFGGGPIAGAIVYLFDSSGDFVAAASTDVVGNYSIGGLLTDEYRALAAADGHTPQLYNNIECPDFGCSPIDGTPIAVIDGSATTGVNFALQTSTPTFATITGTVTGPGAVPLEGMTVVLFNTSGVATASSSTNADGFYEITLDHSGTFFARTFNGSYPGLVDSLYSGINCTACNPTSGTSFTASLGATTSNINFALVNGGRISGRLTDAFDSSPLVERQVAIYNASGSVVTFGTTDASGNYTSFHGLVTGNYFALATAAGFFSQLYNGRDCSGCPIVSGDSIGVTLGATVSNINFAMHSSQAIVKGRVTDAVTGAALGGVLVVFYNTSGQQVLATTSDFVDGSYTIYLPAAGRYYALTQNGLQQDYLNQLYSGIDCSGCPPTGGTPINVVLGVPFENVNFALRKTGGTISGTILDAATSAPAPFGFVQVFSGTGTLAAYGFADPSGQYSVSDGLTTGDYFVIGRAPNYVPVLYANIPCSTGCTVTNGTAVHVTAGQNTPNINFNLSTTTAFITGHVFAAASNTPLEGVDVGVFDSNGIEISRGTSDAAGHYSVVLPHGGTFFARTINTVDPTYHDQLWNHLGCEDCDPTTGTAIHVVDGAETSGINFDLLTTACPTITLSPSTLPNTTIGASYNQQLIATGGATPVTFAVTAGSLPAGLALASNGALTGSATAQGTSTFTITATDANGCTGSATYTISVSATPTTTTLSASATTADFGTVITFTASVNPAAAPGNVTFFDGATSLGTAPLVAGSASIQVASLTAGIHNITATYGGSSSYAPSTSAVVRVTINKATPQITWAPPAPITYPTALSSLQLNATANVPGTFVYIPPAGTVLDAGTHTLTANFTPADTLNYNSASASVTLIVNKATPVFSDVTAPVIVIGTTSTTVTGKISLGTLIPTGSVTVTINGDSQIAPIQAGGTFSATFSTGGLSVGVFPITLTYPGDTNFNSITGSSTLTVIYAVTGGVQGSQPSNPGSTIVFRIQIVDAFGTNLSSEAIVVTAYGVLLSGETTWLPAPAAGNGSAQFRFQSNNSYLFNLKTSDLSSGDYVLGFTIAGDPTIHTVPFSIR